MISLRKIKKEDINLLFGWANDADVRANAKNSKPIAWDEHVIWFNNKLNDKSAHIYILKDGQNNVGMLRFDKSSEGYTITYSIDKKYRGMGYGSLILKKGISIVLKSDDNPTFIACVKKGNIASEKIFDKLNFVAGNKVIVKGKEFIVYTRQINYVNG